MELQWSWFDFAALDNVSLYRYLRLRQQVFVVEQACIYQDLDEVDLLSRHLLVRRGEEIVACLRLVPSGIKFAEPSIGRVIAVPHQRGSGLAQELVRQGLLESQAQYPAQNNRIGAQAHLQSFYAKNGFVAVSDEYDEDGIPHIDMLWTNSNL